MLDNDKVLWPELRGAGLVFNGRGACVRRYDDRTRVAASETVTAGYTTNRPRAVGFGGLDDR